MGNNQKKICIVGAGGFGREVYSSFKEIYNREFTFMDDNPDLLGKTIMGVPVISFSEFDVKLYDVVIAVGNPKTREAITEKLPSNTNYITLIHSTAIIMNDSEIGEGSIITAGCIVTCNVKIGKHSHLNLHSSVGHDCRIGEFFTTAPGARISGECVIGNNVYFGTNACVRQGVTITDETTVGMGGIVVKNIEKQGIYIGNPLKRLEK